MSTFLLTLGWGFAALLGVATLVALWEHARAGSRRKSAPPPQQPRRAVHLDVDFDQFAEAAHHPSGGDQAQRHAALGAALSSARTASQAWIETEPMVAGSLQVEWPADQAAHATRA